jgi:hypothetical protein
LSANQPLSAGLFSVSDAQARAVNPPSTSAPATPHAGTHSPSAAATPEAPPSQLINLWTRLARAIQSILQQVVAIVEEAKSAGLVLELAKANAESGFWQALGRVFFCAAALRSAAGPAAPPELGDSLASSEVAWQMLQPLVTLAASSKNAVAALEGALARSLAAAAVATVETYHWSEGRCALTLLPLRFFNGIVPIERDTASGQTVLTPVANLYYNCARP